MIFQLRNKKHEVQDFAQACKIFCDARDESGQGASRFPDGFILNEQGVKTHRISYNGKIWLGTKYIMGGDDKNVVVFDPRS